MIFCQDIKDAVIKENVFHCSLFFERGGRVGAKSSTRRSNRHVALKSSRIMNEENLPKVVNEASTLEIGLRQPYWE